MPYSFRASYMGQTSPLHIDMGNALLIQLYGLKHIQLWPKHHVTHGNLNIYPRGHCMFRRILENVVSPDREVCPNYTTSGTVQATLGPREILYFPSMWAHYTTAVTKSVSIGRRSRPTEDDRVFNYMEMNIDPAWLAVEQSERRLPWAKGWSLNHRITREQMESRRAHYDPEDWYVPP